MCLAVPGRIERLYDNGGIAMAEVGFGAVRKEICVEYLPDVVVGDYAIVHVGFAISRLDEAAARQTLRLMAEAGIAGDEDDTTDGGDLGRAPTGASGGTG